MNIEREGEREKEKQRPSPVVAQHHPGCLQTCSTKLSQGHLLVWRPIAKIRRERYPRTDHAGSRVLS